MRTKHDAPVVGGGDCDAAAYCIIRHGRSPHKNGKAPKTRNRKIDKIADTLVILLLFSDMAKNEFTSLFCFDFRSGVGLQEIICNCLVLAH